MKNIPYKTFMDLQFKGTRELKMARLNLNDTYGVVVRTGLWARTNDMAPYEITVYKDNEIDIDNPVVPGLRTFLTAGEITENMMKLQVL